MESSRTDKVFRVILLTHGGADEVLRRLAAQANVSVVGIFVETETAPRRSLAEKIKRSIRYDGVWATIGKIFKTKTQEIFAADELEKTARELQIPIHFVCDYHDADSIDLIKWTDADLGVIYGTNIIKKSVFALPRLGSINLHQGLAPFYRGGAPVFWELFNDESEIGVTIHRVAATVDAGDTLLQRCVLLRYDFARYDLNYEKFIEDFRVSLKEFCAALMAEAVRQIAAGEAVWQPQDLTQGRRYKLPTKREKDLLKRKLRAKRKLFNAETRRKIREFGKKCNLVFCFIILCVSASLR